jgi:hypothetical protein
MEVVERKMSLIYWGSNGEYFGKTVFLTQEEAEKALAERSKQ